MEAYDQQNRLLPWVVVLMLKLELMLMLEDDVCCRSDTGLV